jgi:hypothetical protein
MATFEQITARLQGLIRGGALTGTASDLHANQAKELLVATGMPDGVEMARRNDVAYQQVQTSTLLAPLVAVPTTTAALELWVALNSSRVMVVESLFADQILATAAAQEYAIYACVTRPKAVPSLTALAITDVNGNADAITPTVGGEVVTGVGTTVVANGWRPYGPPHGGALAAATPMGSWEAPINGRLIVRPGQSLVVHVVGSLATASSFQVGAQFYMVPASNVDRS